MEKVYDPENFSSTKPLDLSSYFKAYQEECKLQKFDTNNELEQRLQVLKSDFNLSLSSDDMRQMEELCTTEKLKLKNEHPKLPIKVIPKNNEIPYRHEITEEAKVLETVKCKATFNAMAHNSQLDLRKHSLVLNTRDPNAVNDVEPGSTFIYTILVHIPFSTLSGNRLTPDSIKIQYEIEVLGQNTLLDLANSIKCASDNFIIKEVENTLVDLSEYFNAKEKYPSRCLFIENIFYNDMSHPNSIDYSEVVRKWALEKDIGEFKSESMEGTTFNQLKPRLGFGYVYIHQGNCEHMISFSDSRLVSSSDCLVLTEYPRIVSLKRQTNPLCFVCSGNHSNWIIVNSDRLPVERAFFCQVCCDSYMFIDGKKIGDFQLYPYITGTLSTQDLEDGVDEEIE